MRRGSQRIVRRGVVAAVLAIAAPVIASAEESGGSGASSEGLPQAVSGGISTEPPGSALRGDRSSGLPANQALRSSRMRPVLEQEAPRRPPSRRREGLRQHLEGRQLPRIYRRLFDPPPGLGENDNKRLNPVPPPTSLGQQSRQDPTLQTAP